MRPPPFATGEFGPGQRRGRGGGPRGPRGPRWDKGPGGRQPADTPDAGDAAGWFSGRLPDDWFVGTTTITVDRDEITIVGEMPPLSDAAGDAAAQGFGDRPVLRKPFTLAALDRAIGEAMRCERPAPPARIAAA